MRSPTVRSGVAPASRASSATTLRSQALRAWRAERNTWRQAIVDLCRVESVSMESPPSPAMRISATRVRHWMDRAGLEHVRILQARDSHPSVVGDWLHAPGRPTLLFYAHHDIVPVRPVEWATPPFRAVRSGSRLYARGAADDKGGITAILGAIASFLRHRLDPPCNLRVLVDGEEEIGSPHLGALLHRHRREWRTDAVVVLDTPLDAPHRPALTYGLRGNCIIDMRVSCLARAVHSGRGGGLAPDAIHLLCRLLAAMQDQDGALAVRTIAGRSRAPDPRLRGPRRLRRDDVQKLRRELQLLPGVQFTGNRATRPLDRIWHLPAVTVLGIEAPDPAKSSNQIAPTARARLSLRTVPGLSSEEAGRRLVRWITRQRPHGARVEARIVRTVPWWRGDPDHPFQQRVRAALRSGFGAAPDLLCAGGSIGFMDAVQRELGSPPCALIGLEDPQAGAHAQDESLHLGVWDAATRSLILLVAGYSGSRGDR